MTKPIIESKGNGKALNIVGIIFIAISIILAVLLRDSLFEGDEFTEQLFTVIPTFLSLALGAFLIMLGINFSKTRISIYDDHIEGVCVVENATRNFYLKYEKISSISHDKGVVLIQSDAITHKINLSTEKANQVISFVNSKL